MEGRKEKKSLCARMLLRVCEKKSLYYYVTFPDRIFLFISGVLILSYFLQHSLLVVEKALSI